MGLRSKCYTQVHEHIGTNKLLLPSKEDSISLVDHDLHSFIPYGNFLAKHDTCSLETTKKIYCATAQINGEVMNRPWSELKNIVDKVHKHVCGRSTYSNMKILLQRDNLWSPKVMK